MKKINWKDIIFKIVTSEILISLIVFAVALYFVVNLTLDKVQDAYSEEFWRDVYVEAHGMLFDILIIGTIIFALHKLVEYKREKRRNIQRWQEEIDDFRGWDEKEAICRIVGNIKRLNRNGFTNINLYQCYLKNANLKDIQLREADLRVANLQKTILIETNLQEADLTGTDLREANLCGANLQEANLTGTKLQRAELKFAILKKACICSANFYKSNLYGANLQEAQFMNVKLREVDFCGADLQRAVLLGVNFQKSFLAESNLQETYIAETNFNGANLSGVNFQGADLQKDNNLTIEQLSNVKTLYKAKLDPDLEKEIKEKYPHLLEKPKEEK